MKYAVEMVSCGMIYLLSFMKINVGVQAILRVDLSNLNNSNYGIIFGRDL
jgi:hypothetical protein